MATPTTVTKIVDPAGGTGVDYTSLSAWEAARQRDLVTANEIERALCRNSTGVADPSTSLFVDGWTTNGTCRIIIEVDEAYQHLGYASASGYRLTPSGQGTLIGFLEVVTVIGMQFFLPTSTTSVTEGVYWYVPYTSDDICYLRRCIVHRSDSTASTYYNRGLTTHGPTRLYVINSVFTNFVLAVAYTAALCNVSADASLVTVNCTAYYNNCAYYQYAGHFLCVNCIGVTANGNNFQGTFDVNSRNNLSSDTSAPGSYSRTSTTPTFINAAGFNLHLQWNDDKASGYGYNWLGVGYDIDGTCPVSPVGGYSIGADQKVPLDVYYTVKTDGKGDYSSLSAAEAGLQQDLTSPRPRRMYITCYAPTGTADTTKVVVDGWSTNALAFLQIQGETKSTPYKWDSTKYRLVVNDTRIIEVCEACVRLKNLQLESSYGNTGYGVYFNLPASELCAPFLARCIVVSSKDSTNQNLGVYVGGGTVSSGSAGYIYSNLIYGWKGGTANIGAYFANLNCGMLFYNNTIVDCKYGVSVATNVYVHAKNNLAQTCYDGFFGSYYTTSTNNASDISSDAPGSNPKTGSATFVNAAGKDYRLHNSDSVAKDQGADLSSDSYLVPDYDLEGNTFKYGSWDIGCLEHTPVTFTPNEVNHGHTADGPLSFTQLHIMVVADTLHDHTVEGPLSFTQLHIMVVADCWHEHTADNCDVNVWIPIFAEDVYHEHTVEGPLVVDYFFVFTGNRSILGHKAKNVRFTQLHIMVVADTAHDHTADQCGVNTWVNLVVAEATHDHSAEGPLDFTQSHNIQVQSAISNIISQTILTTGLTLLTVTRPVNPGSIVSVSPVLQVRGVTFTLTVERVTVSNL